MTFFEEVITHFGGHQTSQTPSDGSPDTCDGLWTTNAPERVMVYRLDAELNMIASFADSRLDTLSSTASTQDLIGSMLSMYPFLQSVIQFRHAPSDSAFAQYSSELEQLGDWNLGLNNLRTTVRLLQSPDREHVPLFSSSRLWGFPAEFLSSATIASVVEGLRSIRMVVTSPGVSLDTKRSVLNELLAVFDKLRIMISSAPSHDTGSELNTETSFRRTDDTSLINTCQVSADPLGDIETITRTVISSLDFCRGLLFRFVSRTERDSIADAIMTMYDRIEQLILELDYTVTSGLGGRVFALNDRDEFERDLNALSTNVDNRHRHVSVFSAHIRERNLETFQIHRHHDLNTIVVNPSTVDEEVRTGIRRLTELGRLALAQPYLSIADADEFARLTVIVNKLLLLLSPMDGVIPDDTPESVILEFPDQVRIWQVGDESSRFTSSYHRALRDFGEVLRRLFTEKRDETFGLDELFEAGEIRRIDNYTQFVVPDELTMDQAHSLISEKLQAVVELAGKQEDTRESLLTLIAETFQLLRWIRRESGWFSIGGSSRSPISTESIDHDRERIREIFSDLVSYPSCVDASLLGELVALLAPHGRSLDLGQSVLEIVKTAWNKFLSGSAEANVIEATLLSVVAFGEETEVCDVIRPHGNVVRGFISRDRTLDGGFWSRTAFPFISLHCVDVLDVEDRIRILRERAEFWDDEFTPERTNINVTRPGILEETFSKFRTISDGVLRRSDLVISIIGEEGSDYGGVRREWIGLVATEFMSADKGLFEEADIQGVYKPRSDSALAFGENHLEYFEFFGRFVASAVLIGEPLPAMFTETVYKALLNESGPSDYGLESPDHHMQLERIRDMTPEDPEWSMYTEDLTFTVDVIELGKHKEVELIEGGAGISVTNDNKNEYIELVSAFKTRGMIESQLAAMAVGFNAVIPRALLRQIPFSPTELRSIVSGSPDVDLADLKAHTVYEGGYTDSSDQVRWLWEMLEQFDQDQLRQFLAHVTGSANTPLGGFKNLREGIEGVHGRFKIDKRTIDRTVLRKDKPLPVVHTCFSKIDLPEYASKEELIEKFAIAMEFGGKGFGLA
jgi:hypothetical protein